MIVVRDDSVGCSAHRNKRTCTNRATIKLSEIEQRVLGLLQHHLLAPEVVAASVEAYRAERERLNAEKAQAARSVERDLASIDLKTRRLLEAIESGEPSRVLTQRVAALEAERAEIVARTPAPIADNVLRVHPAAAKRYAQKVADIRNALTQGDEAAREAVALVRELIRTITVTPGDEGGGPARLEVSGDLAVMLEQGTNEAATSTVAGSRYQSSQLALDEIAARQALSSGSRSSTMISQMIIKAMS